MGLDIRWPIGLMFTIPILIGFFTPNRLWINQ